MATPVRILVVDDDPEMRGLLAEELRREGWQVREAGDGAEAVLACRGTQFDVILMDKNMPGPSGLDLLPGFRRTCPGSRIIMMTAFGDVPSYVEAAEKGAVLEAAFAARGLFLRRIGAVEAGTGVLVD